MAKITNEQKIYARKLMKIDEDVLKFIEKFWCDNNGNTPNLREICENVRYVNSINVCKEILDRLEIHGYVKIIYGKRGNMLRYNYIYTNISNIAYQKKDRYDIPSIKVAKVPFIFKVKNKEEVLSEENFKEYLAYPLSYGKEQNLYSFEAKNSKFSSKGIFKHSYVLFDTKEHYIHEDIVAYYNKERNIIDIKRYERGKDEGILGKVVGTYTTVTY